MRKRITFAILMMFMVCALAVACGEEAETDAGISETSHQLSTNATTCDPPRGYDRCHEVPLDQMNYWQDTLPDPEWRNHIKDSETGEIEVIELFPEMLNGGFVLTQANQGFYENEQEFEERLKDFLGVDDIDEIGQISIVQVNSSVAIAEDRSRISEGSLGDMMLDALTDENGIIHIGEEEYDLTPHAEEQIIENREGELDQIHQGFFYDSDTATYSTGNNSVDHRASAYHTFPLIQRTVSRLTNLKIDGDTGYWRFWPYPRRVSVTSNMELDNTFCIFDGDHRTESESESASDVSSLRLNKSGPWAYHFSTPVAIDSRGTVGDGIGGGSLSAKDPTLGNCW